MKWIKASELPSQKEGYFKGKYYNDNRELNLHWDGEFWFVIHGDTEVKIPKNEIKYYEYWEECLIKAIRVVRHSRNVLYSVSVEQIRSEGVMTEIELEEILGKEEYQRLCEKAFKKGE